MTDSVLQKYARNFQRGSETQSETMPESSPGELTDCGAFGFLRGHRDRCLMLEIRRKDGNIRAVGYAWLSTAEFDPSSGITLQIAGQQIRIIGRHLNTEGPSGVRLFEAILRHRVSWIQESDEPMLMQASDNDIVVERVIW